MLGLDSPIHWLIVLLIVMLVFGTKKLRNIGSDLGAAVKGFKEGMKGEANEGAPQTPARELSHQAGQTIEGEAKKETKV